jgi:hypothetical protein
MDALPTTLTGYEQGFTILEQFFVDPKAMSARAWCGSLPSMRVTARAQRPEA